jgi:hypothetical protein
MPMASIIANAWKTHHRILATEGIQVAAAKSDHADFQQKVFAFYHRLTSPGCLMMSAFKIRGAFHHC